MWSKFLAFKKFMGVVEKCRVVGGTGPMLFSLQEIRSNSFDAIKKNAVWWWWCGKWDMGLIFCNVSYWAFYFLFLTSPLILYFNFSVYWHKNLFPMAVDKRELHRMLCIQIIHMDLFTSFILIYKLLIELNCRVGLK